MTLALVSVTLASCGSSNHTATTPTPTPSATPIASQFEGSYFGTWSFFAASAPDKPLYGGSLYLTISSAGAVAASFTDTDGMGAGSFQAGGAVDSAGTITFIPPTPNLVGEPTFAGTITMGDLKTLHLKGSVFYDFPGTGTWSADTPPSPP